MISLEVNTPLRKDDRKVIIVAVMIAIVVVGYFALQKFRGSEEPAQASYNSSSSENAQSDRAGTDHSTSQEDKGSFWEGLTEGQEVDVRLHGSESNLNRVVSLLEHSWSADYGVNIHNETGSAPFLIDTWLKSVESAPLAENSWVLLLWDEWQDGDLTTVESYVRQLLSEQPHLVITIVSDRQGELENEITSLAEAYELSLVTVDEMEEGLPSLTFASLPGEALYSGTVSTLVDRVDHTDLFYGDVERRAISTEGSPFLFNQYYALFGFGSQVDYSVTGKQVGIVYLTDTNGGIASIEVNGEVVREIDCYSEALSQRVAWIPVSGSESQTLSIKYTGEHHEQATDSQVFIEGLIVISE